MKVGYTNLGEHCAAERGECEDVLRGVAHEARGQDALEDAVDHARGGVQALRRPSVKCMSERWSGCAPRRRRWCLLAAFRA